ncbi:hypothetical protein ACFEN6_004383, partial [Salmonella enterica]
VAVSSSPSIFSVKRRPFNDILTSLVFTGKKTVAGQQRWQYSVTLAFRHATAEVSGVRHLP